MPPSSVGETTQTTMHIIRNFGGQKEIAWHFLSAERKDCHPIILYPVKMPFRNEREMKTFSDEGKLENLSKRKRNDKTSPKDLLGHCKVEKTK